MIELLTLGGTILAIIFVSIALYNTRQARKNLEELHRLYRERR